MLTIETLGGDHIKDVIGRAIAMAFTAGETVQFKFNGVAVTVDSSCAPDLVYRDWARALAGCIGQNIGPTYAATLTEAEQASDASVYAANAALLAAQRAEYQAQLAAKRSASDAEIAGHDMTMSGADGIAELAAVIDANSDVGPYATAAFDYAQRWARTMEARMEAGATLASCHKQAGDDADVYGLSGHQQGWAAGLLCRVWAHGNELRAALERKP